MPNNKPTRYRVDYYYERDGARTRTKLGGYVSQHLHGATTENAVLAHLRKMHPGYEITIMSLDWE